MPPAANRIKEYDHGAHKYIATRSTARRLSSRRRCSEGYAAAKPMSIENWQTEYGKKLN